MKCILLSWNKKSNSIVESVTVKAKYQNIVLIKEEEESDNKLLLTAKSSKKLEKEIKIYNYFNKF